MQDSKILSSLEDRSMDLLQQYWNELQNES